MSDRSFHLRDEVGAPLPACTYTRVYTGEIETLVKRTRARARGTALTRDRDDLQLLNSPEAARSPHVPARIQVSNPGKDDEKERREREEGGEG